MKKKFSSLLLVLLILVVQIGLFTSCKKNDDVNSSKSGQLTKVRFANLQLSIGDMHTWLGIEKGIFKKYGIDLQIVNFPKGGPEALAAAASGQVDMGSFGTPILTGISKGVSIKIVGAPAVKENPFYLVASNDIKSIQDLKGKTVATGALGGGNHLTFIKTLEANGIKEEDVKIVSTGGTDDEMILKSGKVSAVETTEPYVSKIELGKEGHILVNGSDIMGEYEHSYIFSTDKFIKDNPDVIKNFMKAQKESIVYAKEHQNELFKITKDKLKLSDNVIKQYYKNIIPTWDESGKVDIQGMNNAIKILKESGEMDKKANLKQSQLVNLDFQE